MGGVLMKCSVVIYVMRKSFYWVTCPWDPPFDPQGPLKVKYGMYSNTVTCGIVAKLTTSRVRICIHKSHTNLRFNQDLCVIYILLYTMTFRGPLDVKCQVAGELFLQIRTRLVIR